MQDLYFNVRSLAPSLSRLRLFGAFSGCLVREDSGPSFEDDAEMRDEEALAFYLRAVVAFHRVRDEAAAAAVAAGSSADGGEIVPGGPGDTDDELKRYKRGGQGGEYCLYIPYPSPCTGCQLLRDNCFFPFLFRGTPCSTPYLNANRRVAGWVLSYLSVFVCIHTSIKVVPTVLLWCPSRRERLNTLKLRCSSCTLPTPCSLRQYLMKYHQQAKNIDQHQ